MTGIERLRAYAKGSRLAHEYALSDGLCSIADQIERETRDAVEALKDAERALCVELDAQIDDGADPLDVLRRYVGCLTDTIENLRLELGEARDRSADVSMNAYDLLPPDERDAIAWVREHGGVEKIIKQRRDSVPRAAFERKLGKRLRHIAECEEALRRRNATISALEKTADLLRKQIADMRPRLMPEGMEWPRFENGGLVRCGDEAPFGADGTMTVTGVELTDCGHFILHGRDGGIDRPCQTGYQYGQRVKRPAKVLDADGVEIRVGDELWHVSGYGPRTVGKVNADGSFCFGRCERAYKAEEFTHRAPVLAADGAEIREKRDVWWICEGDERGVHAERLRVETIGPNGLIECSPYNGGTWVYLEPSELYVNKPVPAADGKPLREGETVWDVDGGGPYEVEGFVGKPLCVMLKSGINHEMPRYPSKLTHERPVADTWERLEEDADALAEAEINGEGSFNAANDYCERHGLKDGTVLVLVAQDLVRRAKKLAERGQ